MEFCESERGLGSSPLRLNRQITRSVQRPAFDIAAYAFTHTELAAAVSRFVDRVVVVHWVSPLFNGMVVNPCRAV